MTRWRVIGGGLVLAFAALLAVLVVPAQAATRTVHLTANGPSPKSLALAPGDRVVFVNDDVVPHQVRSQGGWQFDSGPIPPGQTTAATQRLNAAGTYRYGDSRGIVVGPQTFPGSLVVKAAAKPSGAPSAAPSRPAPTRQPTAAPTAVPTAVPTPLPTATPAASSTPSALPPSPSAVALPSASTAPTPAPDLRYGAARSLIQDSPRHYGLPVLLSLVGIAGVGSLIGRYLLALPAGRRRQD